MGPVPIFAGKDSSIIGLKEQYPYYLGDKNMKVVWIVVLLGVIANVVSVFGKRNSQELEDRYYGNRCKNADCRNPTYKRLCPPTCGPGGRRYKRELQEIEDRYYGNRCKHADCNNDTYKRLCPSTCRSSGRRSYG